MTEGGFHAASPTRAVISLTLVVDETRECGRDARADQPRREEVRERREERPALVQAGEAGAAYRRHGRCGVVVVVCVLAAGASLRRGRRIGGGSALLVAGD